VSEQELSPIAQLEIYKKGIAWENARIIKLLEEECHCGMVMHKGYMVKRTCPAHTHIALIKGEQK